MQDPSVSSDLDALLFPFDLSPPPPLPSTSSYHTNCPNCAAKAAKAAANAAAAADAAKAAAAAAAEFEFRAIAPTPISVAGSTRESFESDRGSLSPDPGSVSSSCCNRERFTSGDSGVCCGVYASPAAAFAAAPAHSVPKMIKIETPLYQVQQQQQQQQQQQHHQHHLEVVQTSSSGGAGVIVEPAVTVYNLEVKADVVADIANIAEFGKTSDTTQILSTSGESGFFEGSCSGETTFTDLHAFLESDPNAVPIDSRDQQALAAAAAATPVTGEFILTPAHSSDNDDEKNQHLEWTYLEAARPTIIEQHGQPHQLLQHQQQQQQQHTQQHHQQHHQQQHLQQHPEVATVNLTDLTPITAPISVTTTTDQQVVISPITPGTEESCWIHLEPEPHPQHGSWVQQQLQQQGHPYVEQQQRHPHPHHHHTLQSPHMMSSPPAAASTPLPLLKRPGSPPRSGSSQAGAVFNVGPPPPPKRAARGGGGRGAVQHHPLPLVVPLPHQPQPQPPPSRRSAKSRAAAAADDAIRLCNVCGEKAGKHSYYGGQVCPSCRAFFRRSVQSKYSDVYTCSKVQNCVITLKTRKNCQFCRFRLCEKAGMKRSWVLADSDCKTAKAAKNKTGNSESSDGGESVLAGASGGQPDMQPDMPAIVLTPQERQAIRAYVDMMNDVGLQQGEELKPQVVSEITNVVNNKESHMSPEGIKALTDILIEKSRLYALSLKEFGALNPRDQMALFKGNSGQQLSLRLSSLLHAGKTCRQQLRMLHLRQNDLSEIMAGLDLDANADQSGRRIKLEYRQMFHQGPPADLGHERLMSKVSRCVEDDVIFCLIDLLVLFNASDIDLENRSFCEETQLKVSSLLYRYLQSKYSVAKARRKFSEALRVISYCGELVAMA